MKKLVAVAVIAGLMGSTAAFADAGADLAKADAIHHEIHKVCFIARSVNFPVDYAATYEEV